MHTPMKFSQSGTMELPVFSIEPSPYQARRSFSAAGLNELALSIRRNGLLQPITVRELSPGRYQLIAGERRLRACRIAGFTHIRAQVLHVTDSEAAILCMIENLQREGLHFFDEAEGILHLMHSHSLTQEQVAAQLGKQQSTIANKIRLLRLSPEVRRALVTHGLTERHARAILRLGTQEAQLAMIERIVEHGLNVRETDQMVEKELAKAEAPPASGKADRLPGWKAMDQTIRQNVTALRRAGMDVEYDTTDLGDRIRIRVTLPKDEKSYPLAAEG